MNVAVYSGSFNPLHIGHLAIIRHLIEVAGFDMVYLIVSPKNPLKDGISSDTGLDRYNAALEAVKRHFSNGSNDVPATKKVLVDDIELNMPEPHYTIRTLRALQDREPQNRFTIVMGADNLADIRRWREYGNILKDFGAAVFPRKGTDLDRVKVELLNEDPEYNITLLNAEMVDISSTIIREASASGQDISSWLM